LYAKELKQRCRVGSASIQQHSGDDLTLCSNTFSLDVNLEMSDKSLLILKLYDGGQWMNLVIRPVQLSDVPAIHRIQSQNHVMPYILSLPSDRIEQLEERYRKLGPNHHEFVAELDGVVVGHAGLV
jgi:hypothetical protein